jgi:hypothetical protein
MIAMSSPKLAKSGVGAMAITAKPMIDVIAERASAPPVPSPASLSAGKRLGSSANSSRNRTVKCVE